MCANVVQVNLRDAGGNIGDMQTLSAQSDGLATPTSQSVLRR